jgi:molybdenum cofactor guanylyltransferase
MPPEPHPEPGLGAIVLLGGRSTRMGTAKALLDWHGSTMARRITAILARAASPVVAVHEAGQALPPLPEAELVSDSQPDRGPLEGIAAGMRALAGRCRCVFVSGTDAPFLHPDFVRCVARAVNGHEIAAPGSAERSHPLAAVYRIELLARIEQLLSSDRLRVGELLEGGDTVRLDAAGLAHPESLRNLNTPDDYATALAQPEPEIVINAAGAARTLLGFASVTVAAATLGRAITATCPGGLPAGASLALNDRPLPSSDPDVPLVSGDVVTVHA